jgi:hypothetical protein
MRREIILAAALSILAATGAHAEEWCGYGTRAKGAIECGYSSATECESATGKGGVCFVDPDYAANVMRAAPATVTPAIALKFSAGRD